MSAISKKKREALLEKLGKAIVKVVGSDFEAPSVMPAGHVLASSAESLVWEGVHDWTVITLGSSLYSGASGNYGSPTEAPIAKVIKEIEAAGGYLEAETHWAVSIYEA